MYDGLRCVPPSAPERPRAPQERPRGPHAIKPDLAGERKAHESLFLNFSSCPLFFLALPSCSQHSAPNPFKLPPKLAQNHPKTNPKRPKIHPKGVLELILTPRTPKSGPRAPQERPKSPQDRPQEAQDRPKPLPNGAQDRPKTKF